jgi:hypothetical protein
MSNPLSSFFAQPLSAIASRARIESVEYEQLINRVVIGTPSPAPLASRLIQV